MMNKNNKERKADLSTDEEIRKLVIARLKVISPNTIKCIGNEGSFSRDELIERVQKGDKIGKTIERVEMEWLRALKNGIITTLYN
ncbi:MAG: hypothetical protein A2445_03555 [Candidatus Jacksonbacteria bacterium RIFOXYC2_FULL_44_29]|nr:MAG: hypothetical protein UW45_C0031G0006 [Parcubacteria group bacterium GW2011_GWC2_44_22]OGY75472.1 MAG: hypothetical protein A2240_03080 [Candidatus Jacksonbacteria bacterium RIFOXYA2_FULL_43_12]OGY76967.1 MAG: hypothetical protein A2295_01190 [Candidatus Jacksonbacteria bacterium RIFOXYB2_FULL_44_15]OGY79127.1 MAG: hypothetical protein A2550_01450 [Candidatus Jacksonbacteria bacterium RIFOXYD2_FULL_43_21]OGY80502.1 MAG: hypothetical protein A2445_03555 [Candidatus Jacksonbacteria bacteri